MSAPILLSGSAEARGRAQATGRPDLAERVRTAVLDRVAAGHDLLSEERFATLLHRCIQAAEHLAPMSCAEVRGIAAGFDIPYGTLMTFLHMPVLLDTAKVDEIEADGCSTWAARDSAGRAWVAKNRDYGGDHAVLQQVFRHDGPDIAQGPMLCVGSLGAPGAFSSGINTAGLALVDSQVPTADHGPGLSRYLLMTEILARCADVGQALALIGQVPHAGGGCLVLADAAGAMAAVELGFVHQHVERAAERPWLARTNHHLAPALADRLIERPGEPMGRSTRQRLATITAAFADGRPMTDPPAFAERLMGSRDAEAPPDGQGLFRDGQDGDSRTISTVLFETAARRLYFRDSPPEVTGWECHTL